MAKEGEKSVRIDAGNSTFLEGDLEIPAGARGIILFAHGSGSSRISPRNRLVAGALRRGGLATLLFDLLTPAEEEIDRRTGELRFNIRLLADRLMGATDWIRKNRSTAPLAVGYFGASTGAAAALIAAAEKPEVVRAVVSRGGRPDLAGDALRRVRAPTLLIVGANDLAIREMNRESLTFIPGEKRLEIIPGATHLFEEPGALEKVADLALEWFAERLGRAKGEESGNKGRI